MISRFARRRVAVCLAGDGGDELFAGYERYHWAAATRRRLGWLPAPARRMLATTVEAVPTEVWRAGLAWHPGHEPDGARLGERIAKFTRLLAADGEPALYCSQHSHWPEPGALVRGGPEPEGLAWAAAWEVRASFVERQQLADLLMYVPDDLLTKLDRASMAVGLEARVPLLDHRVVEYCFGLPYRLKCRGRVTKYLLRRLLEEHVPPSLTRRQKRGFRVPLATWLRTPLRDWAEDLLAETRLRQGGLFDAAIVRAAWRSFLAGRGGLHEALWGILMFQAWQPAFAARAARATAAHRRQPATERVAV